ncbi:hypothetical protein ACSBR2_012480 [Camellia fascicularis]
MVSLSEEDDVMEDFMGVFTIACINEHMRESTTRRLQQTCPFKGDDYIFSLLNGHFETMMDIMRMDAPTFILLKDALLQNGLVNIEKMHIRVKESLAIFFYTCSQNDRHRLLADRFQHSTETICRHDCVGAIDGTLVDVWVPASRQNTFRGHQATVSQNVLAACDFGMLFTSINSGWEGSAHDNNVIEITFGVLKKRFPILQSMPNYKSTRQGPLVIACCAVHNWICLHAAMDPFFMEIDNDMAAETATEGLGGGQAEYVYLSQHIPIKLGGRNC